MDNHQSKIQMILENSYREKRRNPSVSSTGATTLIGLEAFSKNANCSHGQQMNNKQSLSLLDSHLSAVSKVELVKLRDL